MTGYILLFVAIALLGIIGCESRANPQDISTEPLTITVVHEFPREVEVTLTHNGMILGACLLAGNLVGCGGDPEPVGIVQTEAVVQLVCPEPIVLTEEQRRMLRRVTEASEGETAVVLEFIVHAYVSLESQTEACQGWDEVDFDVEGDGT